ncbi:MAG: hypothetical protein ABMA00_02775 [Gemmatimonas sp.]
MNRLRYSALVALISAAGLLSACSDAPSAPQMDSAIPATPSALIAVGDGSWHILAEYQQGNNNVAEYELGAALLGEEYQGSVFIRVSVPAIVSPVAGSSMPCITSTIMRTEVRAGWTASIKKAGGCDKPIQVDFSSKSGQRATFKWTYIFGLTKVDHGAVR